MSLSNTKISRDRTAEFLLAVVRHAKEKGGGIVYLHKSLPELPADQLSEEEKIILEDSVDIVLFTPDLIADPRVTSAFSAFNDAINQRKAELGISAEDDDANA